MNDNVFDFAFKYLLGNEGTEYTDHPNDSGSKTKYGITKRTYELYFSKIVSDEEIRKMTEETAKKIYFDLYWKSIRLNEVSSPVIATAIFDTGVLYGTRIGTLLAQQALIQNEFNLECDSLMGKKTVALLNRIKDSDFICDFNLLINDRIEKVIDSNPKNEVFRKGWVNRANRLFTLIRNKELKNRLV